MQAAIASRRAVVRFVIDHDDVKTVLSRPLTARADARQSCLSQAVRCGEFKMTINVRGMPNRLPGSTSAEVVWPRRLKAGPNLARGTQRLWAVTGLRREHDSQQLLETFAGMRFASARPNRGFAAQTVEAAPAMRHEYGVYHGVGQIVDEVDLY